MKSLHKVCALALLLSICLVGYVRAEKKGGYVETDLVVNQIVNGVPTLTDANGIVHIARFSDAFLVNPWGVSESQTSPFWISDNGAGVATLHNTLGTPLSLVVSIPSPGDPLGNSGTPTGTVFNIASGAGAFKVSGFTAGGVATMQPAVFLFATEDGTIVGWNPGVNPAGFDKAKAGTYGIIAAAPPGAVYKGLAIATDSSGTAHLYATNFHEGTVDVFGPTFQLVNSPGTFVDEKLPRGFAPFNVQPVAVGGSTRLFVTYAVQDEEGKDDVRGEGHGIVNTFDLEGQSGQRFAQHGQLNSPWGIALAPQGFGELGGTLWIGNFGNGHIDAYDPATGRFISKVRDAHGQAIVIDGLWTLKVGNGGNGGNANTLYFTAGPNDEQDGLFGSLGPN
jgi:uncharacterized protein (TIGR03118 family)